VPLLHALCLCEGHPTLLVYGGTPHPQPLAVQASPCAYLPSLCYMLPLSPLLAAESSGHLLDRGSPSRLRIDTEPCPRLSTPSHFSLRLPIPLLPSRSGLAARKGGQRACLPPTFSPPVVTDCRTVTGCEVGSVRKDTCGRPSLGQTCGDTFLGGPNDPEFSAGVRSARGGRDAFGRARVRTSCVAPREREGRMRVRWATNGCGRGGRGGGLGKAALSEGVGGVIRLFHTACRLVTPQAWAISPAYVAAADVGLLFAAEWRRATLSWAVGALCGGRGRRVRDWTGRRMRHRNEERLVVYQPLFCFPPPPVHLTHPFPHLLGRTRWGGSPCKMRK